MITDIVICAHNEAPRIAAVLTAVVRSPAAGNVIVVCDACTDATATVAAQFPVEIVAIDARTKGTAMAVGLGYVATERVVFIDADLSGLRPEHVTALCLVPPLDGMLVGVRGNRPSGKALWRPLAYWPSISGERRLPVAFARGLRLHGRGWEVETQINAAAASIPHRQIILRGVSNPEKPGAGAIKEWFQVAGISLLRAPELLRYVATET